LDDHDLIRIPVGANYSEIVECPNIFMEEIVISDEEPMYVPQQP
jgi:hypothetical protein